MDSSTLDDLFDLLRAHGPSGHEEPAVAVWRRQAERFATTVETDVLGSAYARVAPAGRDGAAAPPDADGGPAILLLGHVDEIGVIVSNVEDEGEAEGMLRIRPLGIWDPTVLVGQHLDVRTADGTIVPGVVGTTPPHGGPVSAPAFEDLWVDIGARDGDDARRMVAIGDPAVIHRDPRRLAHDRLSSRALDNRLGAWVVLETARRVQAAGTARVPVVACACVLEETLGEGARAAVHRVAPRTAVVVDVTYASDVDGGDEGSTGPQKLGGGPTLTRGLGLHPGVTDGLRTAADAAGIALQTEALAGGSSTYTDVDGALAALGGVATGLLALPLRHMHSPAEVCSLADVEQAVETLTRFCLAVTADEQWERT